MGTDLHLRRLDTKAENAISFRVQISKLLEEAHRALGRLEQVRVGWGQQNTVASCLGDPPCLGRRLIRRQRTPGLRCMEGGG